VDEITHADIDLLMGKRGSTNSAMCLVGPPKAESCATNLNLHSPAISPISENKSFDSAVSSGIRSDHFLETFPSSTSDLAKFDLRVNELSAPSSAPGMPTLRRTSKSSSSLSDKSSGIEQGFESDHPAGGTIKKRPPQPQVNTTEAGVVMKSWDGQDSSYAGNIRIGAGGTLLRRTNSAERLTNGKNYEELQQLLDELHTNVKQAKDIQAKIKSSIEDGSEPPFPPPPGPETPPPPPVRTSSRLSIDEDSLPPPPPELQSQTYTVHQSTLPRKNLPPIAPKPNMHRIPGSPKFKQSYGTLPNPVKKSTKTADQKYKSGRRISFDDNIQLIDDTGGSNDTHLNPSFLQGLEKVVSSRLPPQSPPCFNRSSSLQAKNCAHSAPLVSSEPLYTAVVKPGSGRPRHYAPGSVPPQHPSGAGAVPSRAGAVPSSPAGVLKVPTLPGSPSGMTKVCCVTSVKCHNSSGDSSPEQNRYGDSYRNWRAGETGDYWQAEPSQLWPVRGGSEEPARACDDIGVKPRHSSVPSSPISSSSASRLWGSFRGKKPPVIDKRTLSPYLKTAS